MTLPKLASRLACTVAAVLSCGLAAQLWAVPRPFPLRWRLAGFAVGARAGNEPGPGSVLMPDVVRVPGVGYRMYYTRSTAEESSVRIAESRDGRRWTVVGTVVESRPDSADREAVVGGASAVALPDGRWRVYYNATPRPTPGQPPGYHWRSAVSDDGVHFVREAGVRIDVAPHAPASPLALAGHGRAYRGADGRFLALFSGNFLHDHGPSDLLFAESADGLAWSEPRTVYAEVHDPTVVRLDDRWAVIAMFLDHYVGAGFSGDGRVWDPCLAPLTFLDEAGRPLPARSGVGDVGILRGEGGELLLYTNFGVPSTDIALFRPAGAG
jgi:hypothetical protein